MEVRIGVEHIPKEISIELTDDTDRDELRSRVEEALSGAVNVLWLVDLRGRQVGISSEKICYVELGADQIDRTVGFG